MVQPLYSTYEKSEAQAGDLICQVHFPDKQKGEEKNFYLLMTSLINRDYFLSSSIWLK